ncbi:hypothetical protein B566_EDAN002286 [Ephemera danica]|nr:hypothetical protein B566_EDAN002286 [Ephemera danica]
MQSILQCALMASSLDHRDANASVMKFFYDLVHSGRGGEGREDFEVRQQLVQGILKESGQVLLSTILQASVFFLHSYMLCNVAEVIFELMLLDRAMVCVWLEAAIKSLPTQNSGGIVTATQKQLVDFHKAVTRAENIKAVTHALRDFAHLYR